ncbi:MAG: glycosyltransferase [Acidimicrobiia bacterium]
MTGPAPLSVLQVNHADRSGGGAAVAGSRLHRSLLDAGVDSWLYVGSKASSADPRTTELRQYRRVKGPVRRLAHAAGLNELEGVTAYRMGATEHYRRADVVHFHALQGGYFSYPALPGLTRHKPAVITLHDMWPFTGHCSYSFGCQRWRSGCGRCPYLDVFPAVRRDATGFEWKLKDRIWAASQVVVVSPTEWLAGLARQSMLGRFEVRVIPHGLDTDVFVPRDQQACRQALGLPLDAVVVLFTAASVADRRKGADLLLEALAVVPPAARARCVLLLMGDNGPQMAAPLRAAGYRVHDVGFVASEALQATVYSAADVFLFPTRADNAPLVVLESLACGTPVVTFAVGGVPEMVHPGETGSLAPPEDPGALGAELVALIDDDDRRRRMRPRCRALVESEHPASLMASRHRSLYEGLVQVTDRMGKR